MTFAVVTIGADQLTTLIETAVERALVNASRKSAARVERLSATAAARMVTKRTDLILTACASGSLPAQRNGKSWSIRVGDLDAWAAAGFKP